MIGFGAILESVETELLGREGVSFSVAAKRVDWEPEDQTCVCWRCAGSVGEFETDGDGCATCRNVKLPWDRAMRLGAYEGIVRDAVLDLKFRRWRLSGMQIGKAFGVEIGQRIEAMGLKPSEVVVVPIPMTHRRRIRRGVDHTLVLARGVSASSGVGVARWIRARNRAEQIGLSATDRIKNMRGAFFVPGSVQKGLAKGLKSELRAIVVLDDVWTTGATLTEGCRVLRRAIRGISGDNQVEIWGASVAMAGGERKGGSEIEVKGKLSSKGGEIDPEVESCGLTLRS